MALWVWTRADFTNAWKYERKGRLPHLLLLESIERRAKKKTNKKKGTPACLPKHFQRRDTDMEVLGNNGRDEWMDSNVPRRIAAWPYIICAGTALPDEQTDRTEQDKILSMEGGDCSFTYANHIIPHAAFTTPLTCLCLAFGAVCHHQICLRLPLSFLCLVSEGGGIQMACSRAGSLRPCEMPSKYRTRRAER